MANWLKLYENDLDETRMRFALSKLPETWPVWTAILMECCKHRSDRFSWGKDEQELFGFSDRLKISIPKVNQAVSILCDIRYIKLEGGTLIALKWSEKQDDYLARKSRGYWKKRREIKNITVNHSESHIEERRGEEIKSFNGLRPKAVYRGRLNPKQLDIASRFEKALGCQWERDKMKWLKNCRKETDKAERVVAELENAIKENRIETTPAQFAQNTWEHFQ
jgi:hypothetical protein